MNDRTIQSMKNLNSYFEKFATLITGFTGSSLAFVCAFGLIVVWAISGPLFGFSETWQLLINTGTTIVTFLMVFIIQKSQNKDALAMQIKLNELLAAHDKASNRIVGAEDMSEEELQVLEKFYCELSKLAKRDKNLIESHSIDRAVKNQSVKEGIGDEEEREEIEHQ